MKSAKKPIFSIFKRTPNENLQVFTAAMNFMTTLRKPEERRERECLRQVRLICHLKKKRGKNLGPRKWCFPSPLYCCFFHFVHLNSRSIKIGIAKDTATSPCTGSSATIIIERDQKGLTRGEKVRSVNNQ